MYRATYVLVFILLTIVTDCIAARDEASGPFDEALYEINELGIRTATLGAQDLSRHMKRLGTLARLTAEDVRLQLRWVSNVERSAEIFSTEVEARIEGLEAVVELLRIGVEDPIELGTLTTKGVALTTEVRRSGDEAVEQIKELAANIPRKSAQGDLQGYFSNFKRSALRIVQTTISVAEVARTVLSAIPGYVTVGIAGDFSRVLAVGETVLLKPAGEDKCWRLYDDDAVSVLVLVLDEDMAVRFEDVIEETTYQYVQGSETFTVTNIGKESVHIKGELAQEAQCSKAKAALGWSDADVSGGLRK